MSPTIRCPGRSASLVGAWPTNAVRGEGGITLALDVSGLTEIEAVDIANGVREVGEDEWRTVVGTSGTGDRLNVPEVVSPSAEPDGVLVTSDAGVPTGPETVLAEGEAGVQRWQLAAYPVDPATGSGAKVCTELRVGGSTVSVSCTVGLLQEEHFILDGYVSSLGPERELGDQVLFRGQVHPAVASVRFPLDTGETLDVPPSAPTRASAPMSSPPCRPTPRAPRSSCSMRPGPSSNAWPSRRAGWRSAGPWCPSRTIPPPRPRPGGPSPPAGPGPGVATVSRPFRRREGPGASRSLHAVFLAFDETESEAVLVTHDVGSQVGDAPSARPRTGGVW